MEKIPPNGMFLFFLSAILFTLGELLRRVARKHLLENIPDFSFSMYFSKRTVFFDETGSRYVVIANVISVMSIIPFLIFLWINRSAVGLPF